MSLFDITLRKAIEVICDGDFSRRFPITRKYISPELMQEMNDRLKGGECICTTAHYAGTQLM